MWTGIEFLYPLQDIRLEYSFLEDFFALFSSRAFYLVLPMVLALAFYWLIDKRQGEIISLSFIPAMALAAVMKFGIAQPRPWDLDPDIIKVEGVNANGYSCPSGHTTGAISSFVPTAVFLKNWLSILLVILTILVISARLVLCVHTPLDITVGTILAVSMMIVSWKAVDYGNRGEREFYAVNISYLIVFTSIFIISMIMWSEGIEGVLDNFGFFYGMMVGRMLEHRYVGYSVPDIQVKQRLMIFIQGMIVGAVLLIIPYYLIPSIGTFIGGFLMMLWSFFLYPRCLKGRFRFLQHLVGFCSYPDELLHRCDYDTSVTGLSGLCGLYYDVECLIHLLVFEDDLDFGLLQFIDDDLPCPGSESESTLTSAAVHMGNSHSVDPGFSQSILYRLTHLRSYYCCNQFHLIHLTCKRSLHVRSDPDRPVLLPPSHVLS